MNKRIFRCLFVLSILAAIVAIPLQRSEATTYYYTSTVSIGGATRTIYYYYSGSASGKPLVIMLHGATGNGRDFFTDTTGHRFEEMAQYFIDNGYVVAAPSSRINLSPPTSGPSGPYDVDLRIRWEHETASYASNEDLQLINYIKGTWASARGINTSQVFIWGNSSGGFMAARCAQYFGTGLKGVIVVDAGDPSQWALDNDCLLEDSDFLSNNTIAFSANHSPVLAITNQYDDVLGNGAHLIRKEVNLHHAEQAIGNVADFTNWVIPVNDPYTNHAWSTWGDGTYDEMLHWMNDRKDGSNAVEAVYWQGNNNLYSDPRQWVGASGATAGVPDKNDWVHMSGNACYIRGVVNPGYLIVGWDDCYGTLTNGTVVQQKFSDDANEPDPVCIVEECLSIGGVPGASGTYILYDGMLKNTGSAWDTYVGHRDYGVLWQVESTNAEFNNLHIGEESTATGIYVLGGNLSVLGNMRVGNSGVGTFVQSSGTACINGTLSIGNAYTSNGSKMQMTGGLILITGLYISNYGEIDIDMSAITGFWLIGDQRSTIAGYVTLGKMYDSTSSSMIRAYYYAPWNITYLSN